MNKEAAQLHALFRGNENAYGVFKLGEAEESGKISGKAITIKDKPVTDELWLRHLKGEIGLGIIPIDDENRCRWGCIDVDDYPPRTKFILHEIERHKLPIITCFSKSGGLHLFLFFNKPFPAKAVRNCLQAMAALLALGDKEIFPKQTVRGAVGNWLNMPYFGINMRQCVTSKGQLSLAAFLDFVTPLDKIPKVETVKSDRFTDGPPCLQAIAEYGPVGEHEKHDALMAMGVYLKMADKEQWPSKLRMYNADSTLLPSGHTGIEPLIEDLGVKDYGYSCQNQPIRRYCNRGLCMTRRFGVTRGACMPTSIVYYGDGQTTTNFVTVWSKGQEHEIAFTTEQLLDCRKFREACQDRINDRPALVKPSDWDALLNTLPQTKVPTAETFQNTLFDALTEYCMKNKTDERGDLLLNSKISFYDHKRKRIYFKAAAIAKALNVSTPILEKLILRNAGKNADQLGMPGNVNRRFSWLPMEIVLESLPTPSIPESEEDPI